MMHFVDDTSAVTQHASAQNLPVTGRMSGKITSELEEEHGGQQSGQGPLSSWVSLLWEGLRCLHSLKVNLHFLGVFCTAALDLQFGGAGHGAVY